MQHIILEINSLTHKNAELKKALDEMYKYIPNLDWMIGVAKRHGVNTAPIYAMISEREDEINAIKEIEDQIKINKVEIKLLWKRMRSMSNQK